MDLKQIREWLKQRCRKKDTCTRSAEEAARELAIMFGADGKSGAQGCPDNAKDFLTEE